MRASRGTSSRPNQASACCRNSSIWLRIALSAARPTGSRWPATKSSLRSETTRPWAHRMPGAAGTRIRRMPSASATSRACSGPAPPNGIRVKRRGIVAALDRDRADRPHHVGRDHPEQALRGALQGEAEPLRERRQRGARRIGVERHPAAEQAARGKAPEHQIGVGHGRLLAAQAVAGRARQGAGALRADLEEPVPVEPGDRAAAGADGVDVDHRQADREVGDLAVEADRRAAAPDQGDVGAGPAHVEGDDVRPAGGRRDLDRADDARRGTGERGADRQIAGAGERHQPAARLVDADLGLGEPLAQRGLEPRQVAHHHRLQIGVQRGGREALVLAELRLHLGRQREMQLRER